MPRISFAAAAILASSAWVCAAPQVPPATTPATTASTNPTTQPARGPRGAGRGAGAANIRVEPLADAQAVELTPPLDKNGNFKISPKTAWRDVQPIQVAADTPRGTVTAFQLTGADAVAVEGGGGGGRAGGGGRGGGGGRNCWVYVPAGYKDGMTIPFIVDHDGSERAVVQTQLIAAMDNLIAQKRIPMMGAIFIAPVSRSQEYDTVSGKYADYIETHVIPVAQKTGNVKFTQDPDGRGAIGQSSGSTAAMGMAWFHSPAFTRIISYSGSFTQIRKSQTAPKGAQEYQDGLIPNTDKKPIRIWMEVGSNDLNNQFGDWRIANNNMANALKAKGYDYQYLWADGAAHVEGGVERQTLTEALEWVWKTYQAK